MSTAELGYGSFTWVMGTESWLKGMENGLPGWRTEFRDGDGTSGMKKGLPGRKESQTASALGELPHEDRRKRGWSCPSPGASVGNGVYFSKADFKSCPGMPTILTSSGLEFLKISVSAHLRIKFQIHNNVLKYFLLYQWEKSRMRKNPEIGKPIFLFYQK